MMIIITGVWFLALIIRGRPTTKTSIKSVLMGVIRFKKKTILDLNVYLALCIPADFVYFLSTPRYIFF